MPRLFEFLISLVSVQDIRKCTFYKVFVGVSRRVWGRGGVGSCSALGVMDTMGERFVWGLGVGENFAKGKWAEWTE